ncbi:MAG: hypothetical protein VKP62_07275 [Candidatus Sericytochromatia bacterium]|nr:hypothetical protein [Candidatus Sericytochromatia bacterium]
MPTLTAEQAISRLLADEGWQAPLSAEAVARVVTQLEATLSPEARLSEAELERLQGALRSLGDLATARQAGPLTEMALLDAWLPLIQR